MNWLCFGPKEGRRNDLELLNKSNLITSSRVLLKPPRTARVMSWYGDSIFPLLEVLMVGFPRLTATPLEKAMNKAMNGGRTTVEWQFKDVYTRAAYLNYAPGKKLGTVKKQDLGRKFVLAVLVANWHNCLYSCETARFFGMTAPTLREYLSSFHG